MDILRLAAFPRGGEGGNPAGVVLGAGHLDDIEMQAIAAHVGFAETAFIDSHAAGGPVTIRYFSPIAEVPFCGHATIASAVVLAGMHGTGVYKFDTRAGMFVVNTQQRGDQLVAEFTTPETWTRHVPNDVLERLLELLGLDCSSLDERYPPRLAYAGNIHPLIVIADRGKFDGFGFDQRELRQLMDEQGWRGTVTVLFCSGQCEFEARNLFPVGSMNEDPATGGAAAALGGYLRDLSLVPMPAKIVVRQGDHVGYPCQIEVTIPVDGGIRVSGSARRLEGVQGRGEFGE